MTSKLKASALKELKSRFRAGGCVVTDLDKSSFEFVQSDFPVKTHVFVNRYYIQFSTFIFAKPRRPGASSRSRLYELVNNLNLKARLMKFALEAKKLEAKQEGWPILAAVKLVTGAGGASYDGVALKNLVALWFQDLAEIESQAGFQLCFMMPEG